MSDSDDTWEEFFGPSTELMPSILTALDGILDSQTQQIDSSREDLRSPSPRRIHQATHFYNLSFNVQKILSNITDEETNRRFASDENLLLKRLYGNSGGGGGVHKKPSLEKSLYKSNESLELMSPNVQKMLSNLPDTELVIPNGVLHPDAKKANKNSSFLYAAQKTDDDTCRTCDKAKTVDGEEDESADPEFTSRPLGSYGNTSPSGIASRRPVGRKNMGKYLQVPSESSLVTSSTTSSEVSRPVSLTSLGSCSSSGSSGTHQPGSAYQASAESLDSDPEPSNIQGSADSGIAEESTAVNTREYDVVAEIVETEAKYVEDLHKVIQDYLEPMRCHPDRRLHCDHPDLFGNLEQIYDFNSSFLGQLREAKLDPSEIAKVFINNSGFSPIYTDYCTDYPKTIAVLTKLMGNEETAWYFRDVQSRKEHDLPLGSYLLKPVQRILKYRLLLERLLEICKEEHKSVVDLALTTMLRVADHINSMKRKHENAVRIQEIQSQLYGWTGQDLTTLGELIAEGTFRVAGGQKGKRHVFLFDKLLLLTKCKHDGCFAYRTHIMCSNLMLIEQVNGDPLSFHVLPFDNHKLQCTLRAKSPQNKREWTAQLKRVIIENFNGVVPDHAQQLLMQLGQDLPEQEANVESWTPLKQHSTPQYLEKRSRVRKSTDFSTRRSASHDRSFPTLSWRRKSEPNVEPQLYDTKTVPTRISKIKKAKESTAIFYTGFFDSDTCEVIDESNDRAEAEAAPTGAEKKDECPTEQGDHDHDHDRHHTSFSDSIGKVVTAIIMQSEEFNKAIGRRKRGLVESETVPNICRKPDKDLVTNKADSLPRSFQLNDQIDSTNCSSESLHRNDASQKETYTETETDTSSQVDTNEHPEHKIYRKSEIRSSFLQKYALRYRYKRSVLKETSKIIGARIANPDYEDPQKLYPMTSTNQSNSGASTKPEGQDLEFNAPTDLDLTINETEVLTEFDRRLQSTDCAQKIKSSQSTPTITVDANDSANLNSSQNSDNYYESIFEKSLNEEVVERCDSFRSTGQRQIVTRFLTATSDTTTTTTTKKLTVSSPLQERRNVQRPSVAPPPIPAKPTRCLKPDNKPHMTNRENIETSTNLNRNGGAPANNEQSKGWVETLRRRFE